MTTCTIISNRVIVLPLAALFALSGNLTASNTSQQGSSSAYIENDAFGFSIDDRDYTSGLRFSWISDGQISEQSLPFIHRGLAQLTGSPRSPEWINSLWASGAPPRSFRYGYSLNQLIYTPVNRTATPPPDERPYAGWLGIGLSAHTESDSVLNSLELSIGVLGHSSYAEQTQELVHNRSGDFTAFMGWDTQLPQEPTINIFFTQKRRFNICDWNNGFAAEAITEVGGSLGTFRTGSHAGITLRIGLGLEGGFSDQRLSMNSITGAWAQGHRPNNVCYLLAGARINGVLHDITLDGNVFRSYNSTVDKEPVYADFFAGISLRHKDLEISYIYTQRTKEYRQQERPQTFGTFLLRWYF